MQLRAAAITGDRFNASGLFDTLLMRLQGGRRANAIRVDVSSAEATEQSIEWGSGFARNLCLFG